MSSFHFNTKKQIIVATTSINRPELHINNIPEWADWISSVDSSKYDINWFINIDNVSFLKKSIAETQCQYDSILPHNICKHYLHPENHKSGNFLNACKRLSFAIETFVLLNKFINEDVIIIWLEDDWKLNEGSIPLQTIIDTYLSNMTCINLSYLRNNYIHALAPCVINYNLWKKLHLAAWTAQIDPIDPERCLGLWVLKHFCNNSYNSIQNVTVLKNTSPISFDQLNEYNTLNFNSGFFTYGQLKSVEHNFVSDKYIPQLEVREKIKDVITFIRMRPSHCSDCGRKFMKSINLAKAHSKTTDSSEFYEEFIKNIA
jgi:hypothetical protein